MNRFLNIRLYILLLAGLCANFVSANNSAFQPFIAQGDNLIYVTTADFDGVGAKDFVVASTVSGKVIAFQRPDLINNPSADNRLWEFQPPTTMGIRIIADDVMQISTIRVSLLKVGATIKKTKKHIYYRLSKAFVCQDLLRQLILQ